MATEKNGKKSGMLDMVRGNLETVNSLKLFQKERERLHFLLKHMKSSDRTKGVEWSKYR
jgi:hypothetical protein